MKVGWRGGDLRSKGEQNHISTKELNTAGLNMNKLFLFVCILGD